MPRSLQIKVKTLTGKEIEIDIETTDTVVQSAMVKKDRRWTAERRVALPEGLCPSGFARVALPVPSARALVKFSTSFSIDAVKPNERETQTL